MHCIKIIILAVGILHLVTASLNAGNSENRIHQDVQRRLALGEDVNRLIHEQSPYLLQRLQPRCMVSLGEGSLCKGKK